MNEIERIKIEIRELKDIVNKNVFSNRQIFDKDIIFKFPVEFRGSVSFQSGVIFPGAITFSGVTNFSAETNFSERANFAAGRLNIAIGQPATCEVGDICLNSGNLYACFTTNTWTLIGP